jgi:hypothetical protein
MGPLDSRKSLNEINVLNIKILKCRSIWAISDGHCIHVCVCTL